VKEVLLITGSSGIAAATARLWGADNPVFVVGVNADECSCLAKSVSTAGFACADVRDETAVADAVRACLDRFGRVDALFNVAGVSARSAGDGPLHECTSAAWDLALEVNAKGTFLMCREVLRHWTKNAEKGVILNCGSVLAQRPEREHFATVGYAASKGTIEAMTRSAAAYYAPVGIRLNVIAPALVDTPMSARARANPDIMKYVSHKQPLSQGLLSGDDVARAACFLLRGDSSPITGQVIAVDGGWMVSE
jgi:NAD(P)-dependent dehydrogenase (short-subunit alcohol dehydrogenase family)